MVQGLQHKYTEDSYISCFYKILSHGDGVMEVILVEAITDSKTKKLT